MIQNADGKTVATLDGSALSAGEHFINWNGTGTSGTALPAGEYQLKVLTKRDGESTGSGNPLVKTSVTGVDLNGGSSTLVTSAGQYSPCQGDQRQELSL